MCEESVFPFRGETMCLRCGEACHRKCIHSSKHACDRFSFGVSGIGGGNESRNTQTRDVADSGGGGEGGVGDEENEEDEEEEDEEEEEEDSTSSGTKGLRSSQHAINMFFRNGLHAISTTFEQQVRRWPSLSFRSASMVKENCEEAKETQKSEAGQKKPAKAKRKKSTLGPDELLMLSKLEPKPAPGSKNCVWRAILRSTASKHKLARIVSALPPVSNAKYFEKCIEYILMDASSFPGQAMIHLHAAYIEIGLPNDQLYLTHARECLDSVSCAVLSVLMPDTGSDELVLASIINCVDRFVFNFSGGSMYKKCFGAALRVCAESDSATRQKCQEKALAAHQPFSFELEKTFLAKVTAAKTPHDKLEALVETIQSISCKSQSEGGATHESEGFLPMDADNLLPRFCSLLCADMSTQEKMTKNWHAEAHFITSMLRKSDSLLGIHGYSLATLEQSLKSLHN